MVSGWEFILELGSATCKHIQSSSSLQLCVLVHAINPIYPLVPSKDGSKNLSPLHFIEDTFQETLRKFYG